jgi:hypothetical protein
MREELERYVQRAKEIIEESPQMGEANTKNMLVRPFIEALGWEFYPSEIELEYSVRMASQQTKVDYALMLDKAPSVFVEAKGLDTQLANKHRKQITSYMHNEKGVEWGLLTNGKEYEFYRYDRTPSGRTLGKIPLEQLPRDFEIVKTLSKESVEAGESEQIAERIRARKHAVSTLKTDKDVIAEDVTEVVTDRIGDSLSTIVESEAKELVDNIVDSLKEEDSPRQTTSSSPVRNAISGKIRRREIEGDPDSRVAVFPTRESGIKFLKENNAWGFVRIGQNPDYVGIYVASPEKRVRFFAEVKEIVFAGEADLAKPPESYADMAKFDSDKKVVLFKPGSLHELEDPIPYKDKVAYSLRYTDLESFRNASTTADVF